jgi:hypothetical protein
MKAKESTSATMPETPALQPPQRSADQEPFPPGAVISGKVLCRTRRESKSKDGATRFMISLSILAASDGRGCPKGGSSRAPWSTNSGEKMTK